MSIKQGMHVSWKWGQGVATGTVKEIHPTDYSHVTKGQQITRHGREDNPALLIEQADGTEVIKLASEVNAAD